MEILADANVPEEYVSALRGDGHTVVYSRDIDSFGPEATDDELLPSPKRVDWEFFRPT